MAKVKTITKKLKNTDPSVYEAENIENSKYQIYAAPNGNDIKDAYSNDSLYGGAGDDTLRAGVGNDVLQGGYGNNDLHIYENSSGNDTINLGWGIDRLYFDVSDEFAYSKTGNDLIIRHKKSDTEGGEVTAKNYFKYDQYIASLKTINGNDISELINGHEDGLIINGTNAKKITGSYLNDNVQCEGKVNSNIKTLAGDDRIRAGLGNDTITAGAGTNTVYFGKEDGKDYIYLTEGETLNIVFEGDKGSPYTQGDFVFETVKNDVRIRLADDTANFITIKNYASVKSPDATVKFQAQYLDGDVLTDSFTQPINIYDDVLWSTSNGTRLNDDIKGSNTKADKVVTGVGDDTIMTGGKNDTITINGEGEKIIKINRVDGNDTVVFSGTGVNAQVVLSFDSDLPEADAGGYAFLKSGNNLIIQRTYGDNPDDALVETTTIKDYFKYNNPDIKLTHYNGDAFHNLTDLFNVMYIQGNMSKANTLAGTDYVDSILGGNKADKITTGDGNDTIEAGKGNDVITINGEGTKTVNIGRNDGNDTIVFDLANVNTTPVNVNLVFDGEYAVGETLYSMASNKQDLIIKNEYPQVVDENNKVIYKKLTQTITVKDYYTNVGKINLVVNGDDDVFAKASKAAEAQGVIMGSQGGNNLDGTGGNDIIYAYGGNDRITPGKGSDAIYSTGGSNKYVYDEFTKEYTKGDVYNDTIYASSGNDTISFRKLGLTEVLGGLSYDFTNYFVKQPSIYSDTPYPNIISNNTGAVYVKKGDDLIIRAHMSGPGTSDHNPNYKKEKELETNSITLKDYFKYDKGEYAVKYIDNGLDTTDGDAYKSIVLADDMVIEHSWRTTNLLSAKKSNNYTGTDYNDYIEGSYKSDTLYGGKGNDVIDGASCNKGKDYLYGGEGNDTLMGNVAYMYGGSGNDVYVSGAIDTYQGVNNVISDESGHDTLALTLGKYLMYFDVEQVDGEVVSTGDMYVKDITSVDEAGQIKVLKSNVGTVIENGTTTGIIEHYDLGSFDSSAIARYSASYDSVRIENTANLVAGKLDEWGYSSVQDAIKKADNDKLTELIGIFQNNMFDWTTIYYGDDKYDSTLYDNRADYIEEYMPAEAYAEYDGTMYANARRIANTTYNFSIDETNRYSIINDYGGSDSLYLDHRDDGYSLFFDVEVDGNGNVVNSSRDFYVTFNGYEDKEKGIVIHFGQEKQNAVENIYMYNDANKDSSTAIFTYNQATIDGVRESVAGWLGEHSDYSSVQDVLHSGDAELVSAMVGTFNTAWAANGAIQQPEP